MLVELQTASYALFSGLTEAANIVDMFSKRVWYKLTYEDLTHLKVLCDRTTNFQNMCKAAAWTKAFGCVFRKGL